MALLLHATRTIDYYCVAAGRLPAGLRFVQIVAVAAGSSHRTPHLTHLLVNCRDHHCHHY
jgi:hypothetical protein